MGGVGRTACLDRLNALLTHTRSLSPHLRTGSFPCRPAPWHPLPLVAPQTAQARSPASSPRPSHSLSAAAAPGTTPAAAGRPCCGSHADLVRLTLLPHQRFSGLTPHLAPPTHTLSAQQVGVPYIFVTGQPAYGRALPVVSEARHPRTSTHTCTQVQSCSGACPNRHITVQNIASSHSGTQGSFVLYVAGGATPAT